MVPRHALPDGGTRLSRRGAVWRLPTFSAEKIARRSGVDAVGSRSLKAGSGYPPIKALALQRKSRTIWSMIKTGVHGVPMAFLWSWAPQPVAAFPLPTDVPINLEAGRGGPLAVPVRLESGEELPFLVDTGTSSTFLDQSLEQKLGKAIDTASFQSWGHKHKVNAPLSRPPPGHTGFPKTDDVSAAPIRGPTLRPEARTTASSGLSAPGGAPGTNSP